MDPLISEARRLVRARQEAQEALGRTLLLLHDNGLSYPVISRLVDLPQSTVYDLVKRARATGD